jgi:hypothetical protein
MTLGLCLPPAADPSFSMARSPWQMTAANGEFGYAMIRQYRRAPAFHKTPGKHIAIAEICPNRLRKEHRPATVPSQPRSIGKSHDVQCRSAAASGDATGDA